MRRKVAVEWADSAIFRQVPVLDEGLARTLQAAHAKRQRHSPHLPRILRQKRPRDRAVEPARAAQRPDADVRQLGHGAVQERLHRPGEARLRARHDGAEVRARRRQAQRPRECRLHRAPSHLLRDAGQLLVRRLLQGACDRARLEPDHQGVRPAGREARGHRVQRGRGGGGLLEEDRGPVRQQDHPYLDLGQFLGDGRYRPLRPVLGDLLRPRRRRAGRPAGQPGPGRRPLHRDLEPGLHAVRPADADHAPAAAQALDRHRHGPRAHGRGPAGHARQLRASISSAT